MVKIIGLEVLHKIDWVRRRKASSLWCALLTIVLTLLLASVSATEAPGSLDAQLSPRDSNSVAIEQLLNGLHRAAAESDTQDYFARYTEEAVFLGTDASERWSIAEFKAYAAKPFSEGRGWRYDVVSRHLVPTGNPGIYGFDEVLSNEKLGLCRGSGLVVFDGTRWRVAQYVLSMLIPNAIAASVGRETVKALEQVGQ
jgi:hypothetical protein